MKNEKIVLKINLSTNVVQRLNKAAEITGLSVQEITTALERDLNSLFGNNLYYINKMLLPLTYNNLKSKRYADKKNQNSINYE